MASVVITGELTVEVDLSELWETTLQDYIESNFTLCDVDCVDVVDG